ncbi:autophagy-related protein 2 homolog B [Copidosoma floridanum]|uniref:autophagy-related protein 2 homolog B n=1 Tax=Copidosoma floridanum TaxID=29053 RepID=UPI0006C97142|nr:autophagy-related protein 2 homolog B [Copidosoma floridanum]
MFKLNILPLQWHEQGKKLICTYLIKRYCGQFLEDDLDINKLSINLYHGNIDVGNVRLDVQAFNEMSEKYNLPVDLISGSADKIVANIPWTRLLTESTYIEITGLKLVLKPKPRLKPDSSVLESMMNSMTSSMQLAAECLKQEDNASNNQPIEGIELCANTIDSVFSKIKVRFKNVVIRLEHVPLDSQTGVAIEIRIETLDYSDEASSDPSPETTDPDQPNKGFLVSAFSTKRFYLEGVTFHLDEFPSQCRTTSRRISDSRESSPDSNDSDGHYSSAQISPTQNMQIPPRRSTYIETDDKFNPIMCAKLSGSQEIRLRLKQDSSIAGSKVELTVTLGSLIMFLSPRQAHVLYELLNGLASPDDNETTSVMPRTVCAEKPMVHSDFNRVERELLSQINPMQGLRTMDLRNNQGWSSNPADSDNEDEFLPMVRLHHIGSSGSMTNSINSNVNASMDGSFTANSVSSKSSVGGGKHHKYRNSIDVDPSVETSQFNLRIASVALVLLHEEILIEGVDGGLSKTSINVMKSTAEEFFNKLGALASNVYGNKDFEKISQLFSDICQLSHLRFLGAPLVINGSEEKTMHGCYLSGNLTLASLGILECLFDKISSQGSTFVELLTFIKDNAENNAGFSNKMDLKMSFKYTQKAVRRGQMTRYIQPRTLFDIELAPCQGEFDITIVDRISALLNPSPICVSSPATVAAKENMNQHTLFKQAVEGPSLPDSHVDIKVSTPKCAIKLRFPIPDLRPLHDINRTPWWKREVRPDYVTLNLTDAKLHTSFESNAFYLSRHEVQCRHMLLTYTEADSDIPLEIGKVSSDQCRVDDSMHNEPEDMCWPRLVVTLFPQQYGAPLEDSSEGEPESMEDSMEHQLKYQPSPFSSKKIIHESDTPHSKRTYEKKDGAEVREGEEVITPGNKAEMNEFIEEGTRSSRIRLEIGLPCASVQIPSKHLYELIYNRFNTDLLLWKPSAPKSKHTTHTDTNIGLDLASTLLQESVIPKFSMCKSGIGYGSDSDSDEEGIFHSTTDKANNRDKQNRVFKNGQSKICVLLNINQGLLSMYTPVRDSSHRVIPGQHGEIVLRLDEMTIFSVTSYKGDENLGYVCVMSKEVLLHHCGITTMHSQTPPLRSINSIIPKHCQRTIYRSESGANIRMEAMDKDMLFVAVRIQSAQETQRIKTFRVAVGLNNATLKHKVCATQNSWYSQMIDCLDVKDHPVLGYIPPGVLTELHVHFWDSAIDYCPINLPLRSMITLESFGISSNIAAQTNTSTLRFISENVALFISDKLSTYVDLRNDYVCVMDFGLFELSLRLNEKMCGGAPRIDLRASNNVLHLRTCSDSCKALTQLLTYFASDGDLAPANCGSTESIAVPGSEDGESLLGDDPVNYLSKSQAERVNSLVEDAMEDTDKTEIAAIASRAREKEKQMKVFFFPDESKPTASKNANENTSAAESENAVADHIIEYDDPDDDFCILGEEAGVGILPRTGLPEVRWLCNESLRIVDNHFPMPIGKVDMLKAPKNFPAPVLKYTLCEMTLVWHMYGGKDFGEPQQLMPFKKHITIYDNYTYHQENRSHSALDEVTFSKASPNKVHFGSVPSSPRARYQDPCSDWKTQGGPGRNLNVLMELQLDKVRFQHDVYPDNTKEASRQVLLISNIEMRDRLATSQINKFLYQYSSDALPKQTHANMFSVRALHVRPDPQIASQECSLKISLLPVRLNIDQDSLLFLISFFSELGSCAKQDIDSTSLTSSMSSLSGSKQGTPTHHPVMCVAEDDVNANDTVDVQNNANIDQNLMILLEDELTIKESKPSAKIMTETQDLSQPVYFRSVTFAPEVLVRLDYHGRNRIDLTHGPLAGLIMGLTQLNCSELRLKKLMHRHGLLGFEKLIAFIFSEWLQDIKKNQLPSLLGGVGPMHSLVQLFQGIRDLFWLPIEQYQKDGRIVRGLQRGANSFTTSTAMAALELTSRLVLAIQSTAETAYDMVSPGPSVRRPTKGRKGRKKRYNQPLDIREGMTNAYMLVKEGINETATQLVRVASEEHEQKGVTGAVGAVVRQIPPTVVAPFIIATEATNNVLGGMRSQLVPDARREAVQKWRMDSN